MKRTLVPALPARASVRCSPHRPDAFSGVQVNLPYFEVDIFSFARIITVFFGRKSWLLALVHWVISGLFISVKFYDGIIPMLFNKTSSERD